MKVLKQPVISEKMTKLGETLGHYGFLVDLKANKIQIKQAVESMYGVAVDSVNTMQYRGKVKTRGTKSGFTKGVKGRCKKAIVTLKKGETIDFYSSI
ncbi:MAG: 50S ribosomal protein L23 [Bacteroidia bacterium]